MSQSFRLGLILIGLGIFILGVYIQKKEIEGFETTGEALQKLAEQQSNPPPQPISDANIIQHLVSKDTEIRSKFDMIMKNKSATDVSFLRYLTPDTIIKLSILFKEVFHYINNMQDFQSIFLKASKENQNTLRQLVYTVNDQVSMLYNIYYTIPSTIISTDTIVKSDTAGPSSVQNENVLEESAKQVSALLSNLPSASSTVNKYLSNVIDKTNTLTNATTQSEFKSYNDALTIYLNTLDVQQDHLSKIISDTNIAFLPVIKTDETGYTKIQTAINDNISFITTTISSLQSMITILQSIQNPISAIAEIITKLNTRIISMQASLTAMNQKLNSVSMMHSSKEPFISYKNPDETPNTKQMREFNLGKRAYTDEVFSGIKFW